MKLFPVVSYFVRLSVAVFLFFCGNFFIDVPRVLPLAHADGVCNVTADTIIDSSYIATNSCSDLDISGTPTIAWSGTVDLGGGTVTVSSGTPIFSGAVILGSMDSFVIDSGASVTHAQGDLVGINITAANITVNGHINANGKGCAGGSSYGDDGLSPGGSDGTEACADGVNGYAHMGGGGGAAGGGGSYGGLGGSPSGTVYGSSLVPVSLGSGGGGGYFVSGGNGGGRVQLTVSNTLNVSGTISADGSAGASGSPLGQGGGASGGSVYIVAHTLTGVGTITALGGDGGTGGWGGVGGGGGRVAVYSDSLSGFDLSNILANKGVGTVGNAVAGTTWILDRSSDDGSGNVYVTSGFDFPASGDYSRTSFTINSGAILSCGAETTLTISTTANYTDNGSTWNCSAAIGNLNLTVGNTLTTDSIHWNISNTDAFSLSALTWSNTGTQTFGVTKIGASAGWSITNSLTLNNLVYSGANSPGTVVADGGMLTFSGTHALNLVNSQINSNFKALLLSSLSVDSDSSINASGKGCAGGASYGDDGLSPGGSEGTEACADGVNGYAHMGGGWGGPGGGGSYGGLGGSPSGTVYGSSLAPVSFGSGGGGGYLVSGGSAGGRVQVTVSGTLTLAGSIFANGNNGSNAGSYGGAGGGSGGSIYIRAATLAGSGVVSASGGDAGTGSPNGGGGGGGRIALYYNNITASYTSNIAGGSGTGSEGSLYTLAENAAPDVPTTLGGASLIDGSNSIDTTPTFSFTVTDPNVSDTVQYEIQISTTNTYDSLVVDYMSALAPQGPQIFTVGQEAGDGTYLTEAAVLPAGSYYWRVKAFDNASLDSVYANANDGTSPAFVIQSSDLSVANEIDSTHPHVADTVYYRLTVHNAGPDNASGVTVQISYSNLAFSYVSSSVTNAVSYNSTTKLFTVGSLANGADASVELVLQAQSAGNYMITSELITADQSDPDSTPGAGTAEEDDYTNVGVSTSTVADISILSYELSDPTPSVGDGGIYVVTLANVGPATADSVEVRDILPSGVTFVSFDGDGVYDAESGIWSVDLIPVDETVTLNIHVRFDSVGTVTNTFEIIRSLLYDPNSIFDDQVDQDDYKSIETTVSEAASSGPSGTGAVIGHIFTDTDGNGAQDSGEVNGYAGVIITITNGVLTYHPAVDTDGNFTQVVEADSYTVTVVGGTNTIVRSGDNPVIVDVSVDETVNIGNRGIYRRSGSSTTSFGGGGSHSYVSRSHSGAGSHAAGGAPSGWASSTGTRVSSSSVTSDIAETLPLAPAESISTSSSLPTPLASALPAVQPLSCLQMQATEPLIFKDINTLTNAKADIDYLSSSVFKDSANQHIIQGNNGYFQGNRLLTRFELTKLILASSCVNYMTDAISNDVFVDVSHDQSEQSLIIAKAYNLGIIQGVGNQFFPQHPVTYGELFKILIGTAIRQGYPLVYQMPEFPLQGITDESFRPYAEQAVAMHLIDLGPDNIFPQNAPVTRYSVVKILAKYFRLLQSN